LLIQYKNLPSASHSGALMPNYYSFNSPTETFVSSSGFVHVLKSHRVVNTMFSDYQNLFSKNVMKKWNY